MALPDSGTIKLSDIAAAVAGDYSIPTSLHDNSVQAGFMVPDAMSDFYGYGASSGTASYYVVKNIIGRCGYWTRQKKFAQEWKLYHKPSAGITSVADYTLVATSNTLDTKHSSWLTTIKVIQGSGGRSYVFPNGGTTTYGEQYYIKIMESYLPPVTPGETAGGSI